MAKAKYLKFQDSEVLVDYATTAKQDINGKAFKTDYCKRLVLTGDYVIKSFTTNDNKQLTAEDAKTISTFLDMEDSIKKSYGVIYLENSNLNLIIQQYNSEYIYAVTTASVSDIIDYLRDIDTYIAFEISITKTHINIVAKPEKVYINLFTKYEGEIDVYVDVLKPDSVTYFYIDSNSHEYKILTYQTSKFTHIVSGNRELLYLFYANEDWVLKILIEDCFSATNGTYSAQLMRRKKVYAHNIRLTSNLKPISVIANGSSDSQTVRIDGASLSITSYYSDSVASSEELRQCLIGAVQNGETFVKNLWIPCSLVGDWRNGHTDYVVICPNCKTFDATTSSNFSLSFYGSYIKYNTSTTPPLASAINFSIPSNNMGALLYQDDVLEIGNVPFSARY